VAFKHSKISTQGRPRIYYFQVLDCKRDLFTTFETGNAAQITTEVHLMTGADLNEFSYEDIGSLRLYAVLSFSFAALFTLMLNSYIKFYKVEKTWLAPHPFVVGALAFQVLSTFLQMLHLWYFASDGQGSIVVDVASKVCESISESTMSLLLFLLASGWKL